ncbi:MAG TPA: hypothetical protein VKV96_00535 [Roseiarcus sp.]|nr:hypothetical protein [Roseiarcus sp.]
MMDETDENRLVALLDNQLDEAARRALEARLAAEPELRARYQRLAAGGLPFARAFDAALAEAPAARMRARLDSVGGDARPAPPRRRWTAGAAAAAIVLFGAGWAVGRYISPPGLLAPMASAERDTWRDAVASYVALYTRETFAGGARDEAAALARLSQALGVALTPDTIALPDLTFKWADMLAYEGAPLGQVAYLDGGDPVVFCIIRDSQKEAPVKAETREGVAIASWARGGHGFLVGGRISPKRATELAETLAARF